MVMLADSVEAAVRSMADRTEGKIEALVRKIIKERLEDGQLDLSELTLKDLDIITTSFIRVFSGFFHAREQYPDIKMKNKLLEDDIYALPEIDAEEKTITKVDEKLNESINEIFNEDTNEKANEVINTREDVTQGHGS